MTMDGVVALGLERRSSESQFHTNVLCSLVFVTVLLIKKSFP